MTMENKTWEWFNQLDNRLLLYIWYNDMSWLNYITQPLIHPLSQPKEQLDHPIMSHSRMQALYLFSSPLFCLNLPTLSFIDKIQYKQSNECFQSSLSKQTFPKRVKAFANSKVQDCKTCNFPLLFIYNLLRNGRTFLGSPIYWVFVTCGKKK